MAEDTQTDPMEELRYPVGRFSPSREISAGDRRGLIQEIASLPGRLRDAVSGLSRPHLDTPYRPDGWTVRQVVHHVADSHINAYVRFKLALTEDGPTIKPYDQAAWAELSDARTEPVEVSLTILDAVHHRWTRTLGAMDDADWQRTFVHPEYDEPLTLETSLQLYEWHGRHHLNHVTALAEREGWT